MNRFDSRRLWRQAGLGMAAVALTICLVASLALAKDGDSQPAKKKLTGEELFAINCSRCHSERYATERTPAQWKTIMLHMRTRAQIPAEQAKEILKYLQADAGK